MDRVEQYRGYIKQLLTEYASYKSLNKTIERQFVCDTENNHYQIVNMGWNGHRRIYGCTIHIDIKNGKIWIQHNMTEIDLAQELVSLGVPKEDIVLGFHSPFMRQFTDYAVSWNVNQVDTVAMVSDRNQYFFHNAATRILINGSKSVGTR